MNNFKPDLCHERIFKELKPSLAFSSNINYTEWKIQVKSKLIELLGDMPEKIPLDVMVEWENKEEGFIEKRIVFTTEEDTRVPCHLLIPINVKEPCPVIICLQGHTTGMHISLGRSKYDGDEEFIVDGDRDFAIQIVKEGYAALTIEQRAFGEMKSDRLKTSTTCNHPGMVALLLGRTLLGERIWDVSRAIDALAGFPELDLDRIAIMGNSGGGTTSFYAACMEERIKAVMPSCSICTYKASIGTIHHCVCNYIPKAAEYFDMGDLTCLIAPRPLIVVAGLKDEIYPIEGVQETFNTIKQIYKKEGKENNCKLVIGEEGHRFYANPSWLVFKNLTNW